MYIQNKGCYKSFIYEQHSEFSTELDQVCTKIVCVQMHVFSDILTSWSAFSLKILCRNDNLHKILTSVEGHTSFKNVRKIMCNNPNLDIANINTLFKIW